MSTSPLPLWRRSVMARFSCIALAIFPALAMHAWKLDPTLPTRIAVLATVAICIALISWPVRKVRVPVQVRLLDSLVHAALLAALWPSTGPIWAAAIGLMSAFAIQRLLGGWSANPFPPALLALGIGVALARVISDTDFNPALVSLIDAGIVAAVWLGAGVALILLRLWPARTMLAFALPVALVFVDGGIPATSMVAAAIISGVVLADTRYLPATGSGQILMGAFAGLGTAALWLHGAPPIAIAYPVLLACALSPWIEHLTLPRIRPAA